MFFGLPTLYTILVHAPEICNADFSSLRLAVCAAEILSGEIFNAWNGDWIGDRRVSRFDRNAQRLFVEHRWGGTGIIALGDREGDFLGRRGSPMARDLGRDLALDLRLGLALDQSPDRATMKVRRSSARAQQMRTPRPTAVTANNQVIEPRHRKLRLHHSSLRINSGAGLQGFVGGSSSDFSPRRRASTVVPF